jgi:hypothetical protein
MIPLYLLGLIRGLRPMKKDRNLRLQPFFLANNANITRLIQVALGILPVAVLVFLAGAAGTGIVSPYLCCGSADGNGGSFPTLLLPLGSCSVTTEGTLCIMGLDGPV